MSKKLEQVALAVITAALPSAEDPDLSANRQLMGDIKTLTDDLNGREVFLLVAYLARFGSSIVGVLARQTGSAPETILRDLALHVENGNDQT